MEKWVQRLYNDMDTLLLFKVMFQDSVIHLKIFAKLLEHQCFPECPLSNECAGLFWGQYYLLLMDPPPPKKRYSGLSHWGVCIEHAHAGWAKNWSNGFETHPGFIFRPQAVSREWAHVDEMVSVPLKWKSWPGRWAFESHWKLGLCWLRAEITPLLRYLEQAPF